jgi:hypothetical protein
MAERRRVNGTPKPAPEPVSLSLLPREALQARSAMFLRMTQGEGKPMCYPSQPKAK